MNPSSTAPHDARARPTVIVLASGRGDRFKASGGAVHKLRSLLAGRPVLEHTLAAVRASGLPWHLEDAGHPGMGDSIAAAVRQTADAAGWLILPGDLPLVRPSSLQAVAAALQTAPAAAPRYRGERGHPVGFGAGCGAALQSLTGDQGAAAVLKPCMQAGTLAWIDVEDEGILADIDTVDDLARAEALYAARQAD